MTTPSETAPSAEDDDPFTPHDLGCRCYPHVSQRAAIEASVRAATTEYRAARSQPAMEGLRELRALSEAATPGPWHDGPEAIIAGPDGVSEAAITVVYSVELAEPTHDAAFIVAAVNYVRAAIAATEPAGDERT